METNIILLIITTIVKSIILLGLANFLYKKWKSQRKKYYTDFPILMATTFLIYSIIKIMDVYLYLLGYDSTTLYNIEGRKWVILKNIRFIFSPVLTMGILIILLTLIWVGDNKRIQLSIGTIWIGAAILSLVLIKDLDNFYLAIGLFSAPVLVLSVLTFLITHIQKKLPEVHSLTIAIGYVALTIAQLIRPFWREMGTGNFGSLWAGELLELLTLCIIAYGYLTPASYAKKKEIKKNNTQMNKKRVEKKFKNKSKEEEFKKIKLIN